MKDMPHHIHTLAEIKDHWKNLPIEEVWHNSYLGAMSLDEVELLFERGHIDLKTWDAYRAIWRNTVPRLSSTLINWEF
jgi:hypothetical protein